MLDLSSTLSALVGGIVRRLYPGAPLKEGIPVKFRLLPLCTVSRSNAPPQLLELLGLQQAQTRLAFDVRVLDV